jgi:hypothetical protein
MIKAIATSGANGINQLGIVAIEERRVLQSGEVSATDFTSYTELVQGVSAD